MHAIFFGMKRAFHASLRVMRRPLESFGLTAARFDMLWCIHQWESSDEDFPILQSEIRKKLGVTAATVTRMMQSLEALGLVRRERDFFDRRQIAVSLTHEGLVRVRGAYTHFVEHKAAERVIGSALLGERPLGERFDDRRSDDRSDHRGSDERRFDGRSFDERASDERATGELRSDEQTASCTVSRLGDLLDRVRKAFGDRADLHYQRLEADPRTWLALHGPYGQSTPGHGSRSWNSA